jgi:hypothetical protein
MDLLELTFKDQRTVAAQGITIAGSIGKEIHVLNNTINGSLQGIHVGLTNGAARDVPDPGDVVTITNNTISIILLRYTGKAERHGIFVGNCQSLILENNNIKLERLEGSDNIIIDGIRVRGIFGDQLMITKNYVSSAGGNQRRSFTIGINVNPLHRKPSIAQWLIMYNVVPSKLTPVRVVNGAVALPDTNAG